MNLDFPGAVLGASYREDVGDTRYSGAEIVVRKLTEMGGEFKGLGRGHVKRLKDSIRNSMGILPS